MTVLLKNVSNLLGTLVLLVSTVAYAETKSLPALDAKFETVQCATPCKKAVKRDWWLMRQSEQVELRDLDSKTGQLSTGKLAKRGEIWRHSPDGKTGYLFLMHEDKRAIEYLFDDLRVLGINADENQWQVTSQLISDTELARLKKSSGKPVNYAGYSAESYTGTIHAGTVNDAKVKLLWLPELHIPVKIEYTYPKSKVTIQLRQLNATGKVLTAKEQAPKTTEEVLNSYQQVYYTDIGDMEQNDDAKEWLAKAQGAPGLHAHHH
ncbi:hypothetical protein [Methylotenera sp.]|uniref:hypothetical protein n=1 Tax=Methylotenera sp. TaxID=2051956 RepID=UPI0024893C1A|nr:hypothetical protein [Methylotenera sp.]MDI1362920.1 hypothetical protein [Methylotenera sp.]